MFKPKTTIAGRLENSSGEWIRTTDLRVMSPTSCHCSTPHQEQNNTTLQQLRQVLAITFLPGETRATGK